MLGILPLILIKKSDGDHKKTNLCNFFFFFFRFYAFFRGDLEKGWRKDVWGDKRSQNLADLTSLV
ncbi:hypothetical protein A1D19_01060 [Lonepinella koalarum]|nr:hypothetical protein [Lonepinella koalarum]